MQEGFHPIPLSPGGESDDETYAKEVKKCPKPHGAVVIKHEGKHPTHLVSASSRHGGGETVREQTTVHVLKRERDRSTW